MLIKADSDYGLPTSKPMLIMDSMGKETMVTDAIKKEKGEQAVNASNTKVKKFKTNNAKSPPVAPAGYRIIEVEEKFGVPLSKSGRRKTRKVIKAVPLDPASSAPHLILSPDGAFLSTGEGAVNASNLDSSSSSSNSLSLLSNNAPPSNSFSLSNSNSIMPSFSATNSAPPQAMDTSNDESDEYSSAQKNKLAPPLLTKDGKIVVPPGFKLIEIEEEFGVPTAKSGIRPRRLVQKLVPKSRWLSK